MASAKKPTARCSRQPLDAILARHDVVEDDDVEPALVEHARGFVGVGRLRHVLAARPQRAHEEIAHPGLVVDDQDRGLRQRTELGTTGRFAEFSGRFIDRGGIPLALAFDVGKFMPEFVGLDQRTRQSRVLVKSSQLTRPGHACPDGSGILTSLSGPFAFSIKNTMRPWLRSVISTCVAGLANEVRDVDHRQRIGAEHFQPIAGRQRLQRLARLQRRQRAFQPGKIEFCRGHVVEHGEADARIVNATISLDQACIGQEADHLAGRRPAVTSFAEFDQAVGVGQRRQQALRPRAEI